MARHCWCVVVVAEVIAAPMLIYANQHPDEDNLPQLDLVQQNGVETFIDRAAGHDLPKLLASSSGRAR